MILKKAFLISTACLVYFGCGNLDLENPDKTVGEWSKISTDAGASSNEALSEEQGTSSEALPNMSSSDNVLASSTGSTLLSSSTVVLSSSSKPKTEGASILSLWNYDSPKAQVQVPCLTTEMADNNKDGLSNAADCGGWWYSYTDPRGLTVIAPSNNNRGTLLLLDAYTDLPITGGNLNGLGVFAKFTVPARDIADPNFAGIGFAWESPETSSTDISAKEGYCLDYSLEGEPLEFLLDWDDNVFFWDYYYVKLASTSGVRKQVVLPWSLFKNKGFDERAGSFSDAKQKSTGIKIRLESVATADRTSTITIFGLGWYDGTNCI